MIKSKMKNKLTSNRQNVNAGIPWLYVEALQKLVKQMSRLFTVTYNQT